MNLHGFVAQLEHVSSGQVFLQFEDKTCWTKKSWNSEWEAFCHQVALLWFLLYCINILSLLPVQDHFTAGKMKIQKLSTLPELYRKLLVVFIAG